MRKPSPILSACQETCPKACGARRCCCQDSRRSDVSPRPRLITGRAPCQEVVKTGDDARLSELPILKCWPQDGGRFITLPLVFTKDRHGKRNVGMYRVQVYDDRTAGMHWQRHKVGSRHHAEFEAEGKDITVAIALGGDPALDLCRDPRRYRTRSTRWRSRGFCARSRLRWSAPRPWTSKCPPTPSL